MAKKGTQDKVEIDTDQDRYPTAIQALRRIIEEGDLPDGPFELLEVTTHASGELTYRVREPRADEDTGGYLAAP